MNATRFIVTNIGIDAPFIMKNVLKLKFATEAEAVEKIT